MSEERKKVLSMLAEGKVGVADAERLLSKLEGSAGGASTGEPPDAANSTPKYLRVVVDGKDDGEISSGGFSPTMERSIAMARIPAGDYETAQVEVRNRLLDVRVVDMPFVRNGKIRIDL